MDLSSARVLIVGVYFSFFFFLLQATVSWREAGVIVFMAWRALEAVLVACWSCCRRRAARISKSARLLMNNELLKCRNLA